jgi:23S rRNA (guanosine2251-2'-O)-methyltransferase
MNGRKRFANVRTSGSPTPPKARDSQTKSSTQQPKHPASGSGGARPKREDRRATQAGSHWIYGVHASQAALANPERYPKRILAVSGTDLPKNIKESGQSIEWVEKSALDQILGRQAVHQGVAVLVSALPDLDLDAACEPIPGRRNIVVLLDRVTDPHNVGAILRSAAAFGARAVIVTDRHAPEATAALAKVASGALEKIPMVRVVNLARALDDLADHGYWRIGLDGKAEATLTQASSGSQNIALVLGAEGEGLRRLTTERCDQLARLPISDAVESLNVSNAAAVALFALSGA